MIMPEKVYENCVINNCSFGEGVIVGESSYLSDSVVGEWVQINRRNIIDGSSIGAYSYTGSNTIIKKASIGRFCSISWNVSATGIVHDYRNPSCHPFAFLCSFGITENNAVQNARIIDIGNDVWIGANAVILPGVTVKDGAVIGAGSVVTKDVEPYTIVAGNPAKIIRTRFDDKTIEKLLEIQWWNWTREMLRDNIEIFREPLSDKTLKTMIQIELGRKTENKG